MPENIHQRTDLSNQALAFCADKKTHDTDGVEAESFGDAPSFGLVDEDALGAEFDGESERFGLTGVEFLQEIRDGGGVAGGFQVHERECLDVERRKTESRNGEFGGDRGWNNDAAVDLLKEIEMVEGLQGAQR